MIKYFISNYCFLWGLCICLLLGYTNIAHTQDINLQVNINYEKIAARTSPQLMQRLEQYVSNFINSTQWVKQSYHDASKITGNLLITLESVSNTSFSGFLTIQAERLVYNTLYTSPIFNFKDNDIRFDFTLNQIDKFDPANFAFSSFPLFMNLPATLSFYVNLILGLDADSFGKYRGTSYFAKAFQIANNAASVSAISSGWVAFANNNNRFTLIQELSSESYKYLHTAIYHYYRNCLDQLYESTAKAVDGLESCFKEFAKLKADVNYSLHLVLFLRVHTDEIRNIISLVEDIKYRKSLTQLFNKLS